MVRSQGRKQVATNELLGLERESWESKKHGVVVGLWLP